MNSVLLVGRANVGKSTLFNRLARVGGHATGNKAIVSPHAGATRDIIRAEIDWDGLRFALLDGAGWAERPSSALQKTIAEHVRQAVEQCEVVLFVYDARAGVLPEDKALAEIFRKLGKPIIVLANKCESKEAEAGLGEGWGLGFGEPLAVSGLQGGGLPELHAVLAEYVVTNDEGADEALTAGGDGRVRVCILGRPNVGKSTLVNRLLGEDKALVADTAGVTRDAVEYPLRRGNKDYCIIDTAGLRKRAGVHEDLEVQSVEATKVALQFSEVAVLVIDGAELVGKQDLTIAKLMADEGRAPLIVVNKWDLVGDKKKQMQAIKERLEVSFSQVRDIRVVEMSALRDEKFDRFWKSVSEVYGAWNKRVTTGELNRWLEDCVAENPPPMVSGRRVKIRYVTQAKVRPPTFVVFASQSGKNKGAGALPTSYLRYLRNRLSRDFNIVGVPLRMQVR